MGKAIIYTRYSPQRNSEDSESCETQEAYCRAFCERTGHEVMAVHEDRERSGNDADRPGLWHAIEGLHPGWTLIAYKQDRLARSVYLHECIRRAVEGYNAHVETVKDGTNGDSPEDAMMRQILAAFSEYERKICALRTKYAMRHHQRNGRRMSRYAPYGWEVAGDGTALRENPQEQQVIKQILLWSAEGSRYSEIARLLNELAENDSRYETRGGGKWWGKVVKDIMRRAEEQGIQV